MNKTLYFVRHANAEGQPFESPLTLLGKRQAEELAEFFSASKIERIISSPYVRAIETIQPLSFKLGLPIETDDRLSERVLSSMSMKDWQQKLKGSFENLDLIFEGGESNRDALKRAESLLVELLNSAEEYIVIVSHGNLTTLLLHYFDNRYGFDDFIKMSNPDVFEVKIFEGKAEINRNWV